MSGRYRFRRRAGYRSGYSRSRNNYSRNRTSLVKRARGNAKAANAQADITDVVINLMHSTITTVTPCCTVQSNNNMTVKDFRDYSLSLGVSAINIFDLLSKSDFFNCYAPMYDQFRITSIKVKITPTKWSTYNQQNSLANAKIVGVDSTAQNPPVASTDVTETINDAMINVPGDDYQYPQSLTIVTAWDRTGLSDSQFNTLQELVKIKSKATLPLSEHRKRAVIDSLIADTDMNATDTGLPKNLTDDQYLTSYFTNIGDTITTYSSAQTKQLISGQAFNCTRYLYPQNQQEKSSFYSTSNLESVFTKDPNSIMYKSETEPTVDTTYNAFDFRDHLCSLSESPSIPFKPTLLIGVLGDNETTVVNTVDTDHGNINFARFGNKIKPIKFNCEFDIGVTFRGLRKTQVV